MLRKLHNIFIKIGTLCDVLSFKITSVKDILDNKCDLFAVGETFVYLSLC